MNGYELIYAVISVLFIAEFFDCGVARIISVIITAFRKKSVDSGKDA